MAEENRCHQIRDGSDLDGQYICGRVWMQNAYAMIDELTQAVEWYSQICGPKMFGQSVDLSSGHMVEN